LLQQFSLAFPFSQLGDRFLLDLKFIARLASKFLVHDLVIEPQRLEHPIHGYAFGNSFEPSKEHLVFLLISH
jgi:hypothetical protein